MLKNLTYFCCMLALTSALPSFAFARSASVASQAYVDDFAESSHFLEESELPYEDLSFSELDAEFSVQRHIHRYYTSFEVAKGHVPYGTIIRKRWKQWFRSHYVLYDAEGDFDTSATSRFWSLGFFSSKLTVLDIQGRDDKWYTLEGVYFTFDAARFILRNERGVALAMLHFDKSFTSCRVTDPANAKHLMGAFYRSQVTDYNVERWNYTMVHHEDIEKLQIPAGIWSVVAAFFSDALPAVDYSPSR